jgi:hypothetical protein
MNRDDILEKARSFIGVPWRHQGRTLENGIDCVGLPILVGQSLGKVPVLQADYPRRPDGTFVALFDDYLERRLVKDQTDGDILVFASGSHPCHCGIRSTFRNQPAVIHAHAGLRKVVEQTLESAEPLIGKPMAVFSFPGLEHDC